MITVEAITGLLAAMLERQGFTHSRIRHGSITFRVTITNGQLRTPTVELSNEDYAINPLRQNHQQEDV